jgi:hypothetical protein
MKAAALLLLLCPLVAMAQESSQSTSQTSSQTSEKKRITYDESLPASSENEGAWDFAVWGGGGHRIAGGFRNQSVTLPPPFPTEVIPVRSDRVGSVGVINLALRAGKILTSEHGSGWYRGNFEYAVDVFPVYVLTGVKSRLKVGPIPCPPTLTGLPPGFCPLPGISTSVGPGTVYGAGFNPLVMKWNFTGARRLSPYFELNGGVLFTNHEVPVNTSSTNFMSGAAIGVNLFTRPKRAISLDFRYIHISNAGLSDLNPGINTLQGQIGYHWFK